MCANNCAPWYLSKGAETCINTKTCTQMSGFKFITAKIWRQPRCPRADAWINKLWYLQIIGYYSALKKKWTRLLLLVLSPETQPDMGLENEQRMLTGSGGPREEEEGEKLVDPLRTVRAMRAAGEMCKGSGAARTLMSMYPPGHRGALRLLAYKGPLCGP